MCMISNRNRGYVGALVAAVKFFLNRNIPDRKIAKIMGISQKKVLEVKAQKLLEDSAVIFKKYRVVSEIVKGKKIVEDYLLVRERECRKEGIALGLEEVKQLFKENEIPVDINYTNLYSAGISDDINAGNCWKITPMPSISEVLWEEFRYIVAELEVKERGQWGIGHLSKLQFEYA